MYLGNSALGDWSDFATQLPVERNCPRPTADRTPWPRSRPTPSQPPRTPLQAQLRFRCPFSNGKMPPVCAAVCGEILHGGDDGHRPAKFSDIDWLRRIGLSDWSVGLVCQTGQSDWSVGLVCLVCLSGLSDRSVGPVYRIGLSDWSVGLVCLIGLV